jgi:hypothetical protein
MGRIVITILLPLLLPTAIYVGWRLGFGRAGTPSSATVALAIAGVALVVMALLLFNTDFGGPRQGVYVPPHVSDGKVVPGHFEPAPAAPAR